MAQQYLDVREGEVCQRLSGSRPDLPRQQRPAGIRVCCRAERESERNRAALRPRAEAQARPGRQLTVIAKNNEIACHKPVVYQVKSSQQVGEAASQREPVSGKFTLLAGNIIGFQLGSYDRARRVVIDAALEYSTDLGGRASDSAGHRGRPLRERVCNRECDFNKFPSNCWRLSNNRDRRLCDQAGLAERSIVGD